MNRWVCFRASCRSSGAREVAGALKFVSHTLASCDQLKYYSDSVLSEMNSSRCVTKSFNIYRPTTRGKFEHLFIVEQFLKFHQNTCINHFFAQQTLERKFEEANRDYRFRASTNKHAKRRNYFTIARCHVSQSWSNAKIFKCHNPTRD